MADKIEVWLAVNCKEPIREVLLRRGIAMGNEYRFDNVSWKVLVTRVGDLFLDVLRRAVEHRLLAEHDGLDVTWRTALGDDELLLVPPAEDRQRMMPVLRDAMGFLRDLLFEQRFIATTLRTVLQDILQARSEQRILAGTLDVPATVDRLVEALDGMDLATEGVGAEQAAAQTTTTTDDVAAAPSGEEGETPQLRIADPPPLPENDDTQGEDEDQ